LGQWEVFGTGKQRPHCGRLLPSAVSTRGWWGYAPSALGPRLAQN